MQDSCFTSEERILKTISDLSKRCIEQEEAQVDSLYNHILSQVHMILCSKLLEVESGNDVESEVLIFRQEIRNKNIWNALTKKIDIFNRKISKDDHLSVRLSYKFETQEIRISLNTVCHMTSYLAKLEDEYKI